MRITFVTRKFGNVERNSHSDVHIARVKFARLVPDCNGVFAIKAYEQMTRSVNGRRFRVGGLSRGIGSNGTRFRVPAASNAAFQCSGASDNHRFFLPVNTVSSVRKGFGNAHQSSRERHRFPNSRDLRY